jgi:hypothetical protein
LIHVVCRTVSQRKELYPSFKAMMQRRNDGADEYPSAHTAEPY